MGTPNEGEQPEIIVPDGQPEIIVPDGQPETSVPDIIVPDDNPSAQD
jgi:hypothetical protein